MGYSMPDDQEMYSLEEITKKFELNRVGKSGAVFDVKKLDWLNQQYMIKSIDLKDLWPRIKNWGFNDEFMEKLMPLVQTRIKTFGDFMDLCQFFFINHIHYTKELLCPRKITEEESAFILQALVWGLDKEEDWSRDGFEKCAHQLAELFGVNFKKEIIPILFATIMGSRTGPPLFDSFEILGQHRARARILTAIEFLGGISNKKMKPLKGCWDSGDCKNMITSSS